MNEPNHRRSILLAVAVTAILSALITGGVVYGWQHAKVMSLSERLDAAEQNLLAAEHERLNELSPLQHRIVSLEKELAVLREYSPVGNTPPNMLPVYGATNEHPDDPVVEYYIAVRENLPVIEKLRVLASKLSRLRFSELPINVVRVETVKGKQVAVIDLRERYQGDEVPSWKGTYFQGSTGGGLTQISLYTFLQEGYRGDWVDGVRFLYEGKPMAEGEWDHISLAGVCYR